MKSEGRIKEILHGAVIIATGAEEYKPTEYLYGKDDKVMTSLELEDKIIKKDEQVVNAQSLVMIQCVGCRQTDRNYCSRVCCSQSIKNALKLKESNPGMDIYIIFRDMRTYGFKEDYYREASNKDVKFIRYEPTDKPEVESITEGGQPIIRVTVTDPILGQKIAIDADLLVLAAAVIPAEASQDVTKLFKVALNPDGFFQEAHVKLRPVDFAADGVYSVRDGALSQAPDRNDQPGLRCRRAGHQPAQQGYRNRLRRHLRSDRERLRILRSLYHRLHLRRYRVQGDAAGQEGDGQPDPLQRGRSVQREVSDPGHQAQALHRRRDLRPD